MHAKAPRHGPRLLLLATSLLSLATGAVPPETAVAAKVPRTVFFEKFGYLE